MPPPTALMTDTYESVSCGQPDISYTPDREKWLKRTSKRLAENPTLLSTPLPKEFPRKLDSPLVWEGKDWKDESQWVYHLSPAELLEIDEAVHHFHGKPTSVRFFTLNY